jgi:sulfite reductase alpha subunit-like flavoprotein
MCLQGIYVCIFANSQRFNWAARKLHKRLEQLGAKEVYPRGEADEQHEEGSVEDDFTFTSLPKKKKKKELTFYSIDGTFLPWFIDLRKYLLASYPLPDGVTPIPQEVLLPPKFTLKIIETPSEQDQQDTSILADQEIPARRLQSSVDPTMLYTPPPEPNEPAVGRQLKDHLENEVDPVDLKLPSRISLPIPDAFRIKLIENKRVTPTDHWQDVRLLTFHMEAENEYEPGDVITIFPKNFYDDVQQLIDLMKWNDVADKPLKFEVMAPGFLLDPLFATLPTGLYPLKNSTLRHLLTHNLDITAIPKPYFFQYISYYTEDLTHKERLLEFGNSTYRDEYYDYATRPRRSILEVLADFPSVKLPFNDIASVFPVIRGRQFSICSGGLGRQVDRPTNQNRKDADQLVKVQLLVAIVKYKTVLRRIRQGLCSRYIASLQPEMILNVKMGGTGSFYKVPFRSPESPVIMVAAGTGIAPCRSLIWERAGLMSHRSLRNEELPVGPNILIYGGRNKGADFFFKEEWASAALRTEVLTAFSRDQKEKFYVQDVIRREGKKLVESVMNHGVLYVCGSSGNMPKAVREAFVRALIEFGGPGVERNREEAEKLLGDMEKAGHYVQETW